MGAVVAKIEGRAEPDTLRQWLEGVAAALTVMNAAWIAGLRRRGGNPLADLRDYGVAYASPRPRAAQTYRDAPSAIAAGRATCLELAAYRAAVAGGAVLIVGDPPLYHAVARLPDGSLYSVGGG